MKFTTRSEREELIKGFEIKAAELTAKMLKTNPPSIPQKTKVIFETITNWDNEIPIKKLLPDYVGEVAPDDIVINEKGKKIITNPGEIFVAYIRQPQLINAGQIYDKLFKSGKFEAGLFAFDAMVLKSESSPEVEDYSIKLGLAWRIAEFILIKLPDHKKK